MAEEKRVDVVSPQGQLGSVPADEAKDLPEGSRIATAEEVHAADARERFGGSADEIAAALNAGANEFSFGATSKLQQALAESAYGPRGGQLWKESVAGWQEANPTATTLGGVAGMGASLLAGPGAGISRLGGMAERGAAGLVGTGAESLLGRVAQRGAALGAQGALEGGLYGAGQAASEAALGDHELTAERLLAGATEGAGYGGALGLGLGALGGVASKAMEGGILKHLPDGLAGKAEEASGEAAFRSLGGTKKMANDANLSALKEEADTLAGGSARVGVLVRDEIPALAGKDSIRGMRPEDLNAAAKKGINKFAGEVNEVFAKADEANAARQVATKGGVANDVAVGPRAIDIVKDIEDVAGKYRGKIEHADKFELANQFDKLALGLKQTLGLVGEDGAYLEGAANKVATLDEMRRARMAADGLWISNRGNPNFRSPLKEARDVLAKRIGNEIEDALGKVGRKEYEDANRKLQAMIIAEKASASGMSKTGANQFFSLTDKIGGHVGALTGSVLGGPVGGLVGAGVGAGINRLVRNNLDTYASDILGRLAKRSNTVDAKMTKGVASLFDGRPSKAVGVAVPLFGTTTEARQKAYATTTEQVKRIAASPAAMLQLRTPDPTVAPSVAMAYVAAQANAVNYLNSKIPKTAPKALLSAAPASTPSTVISEFEKIYKVYQDPESVLRDAKHGQLQRPQVEALKAMYPKLYASMQSQAAAYVANAADSGTPVPYDQRIQIGSLFGFEADETMAPGFMHEMQSTYDESSGMPNEGPPPGGAERGAPLRISEQLDTETQRLEATE